MSAKTEKPVAKPAKAERAKPVVAEDAVVEAAVAIETPAVAEASGQAPVAPVAAVVEKAVSPAAVEPKEGKFKMTDTVKDTVKKIEETAKTNFAKGGEIVREIVEFNKGNVEAMVESGKIAAKGAQAMGQNALAFSKKNFEATTAQFKEVAAVKSPADFFKLQGEFARTQFDAAVAETSKATELFVKLAGDVMQPLQNRYALAAEKVKTRLAA